MRASGAAYSANLVKQVAEPRRIVSIDFDGSVVYFTSHNDCPTPPDSAAVYYSVLTRCNSITQKIDPEKALSTIGTFSFTLVNRNNAISELFANYDKNNSGLRYRDVRFYFGFAGMAWYEFEQELELTQIVDTWSNNETSVMVKCADIQRSIRSDIFDLNMTHLSASITDTDQLIPVYQAPFEKLLHDANFTDGNVAKEFFYVKIDDEIVRCTGSFVDPNRGLVLDARVANGGTRGALNTKAVPHTVDAGTQETDRTEVLEYVYIEMPAIKIIYAILTGKLYGSSGYNFPSNWCLNIPAKYVRLADFNDPNKWDLWFPFGNTGFMARFEGCTKQDAKQFIETELCLLTTTYMPIYSNGELGLKRFTSILKNAVPVYRITRSHIISHSDLEYDARSIRNLLQIKWAYDPLQEQFMRQKVLIDEVSISKYKYSSTTALEFKGLSGGSHTAVTLGQIFDKLRDRSSGPPKKITLKLIPMCGNIEVGDIVNVKHEGIPDAIIGGTIDCPFEVQQKTRDYNTGVVTLSLFASSNAASVIKPENPGTAGENPDIAILLDSQYTNRGTNLAAYGHITMSGGHITACDGIGLIGHTNDADQAIYYYNGDLYIDSGVNLIISQNVHIEVKGTLYINGTINGKGRGGQGGNITLSDATIHSDYPTLDFNNVAGSAPKTQYVSYGEVGFIGPTESGGSVVGHLQFGKEKWDWMSLQGFLSSLWGNPSLPQLLITEDMGTHHVTGYPKNLKGSGGSSGRNGYRSDTHSNNFYAPGGAGGNGGAGLVIVARGINFGASGLIDTSGLDGTQGVNQGGGRIIGGSGGGGAPGAVVFVVDGLLNDIPNLTHVVAKFGRTPLPTPSPGYSIKWLANPGVIRYLASDTEQIGPFYVGAGDPGPDLSGYNNAARIFFVPPHAVVSTTTDQPKSALAINIDEFPNTPPSPGGLNVTLEIQVDRPLNDPNYLYSNIYYKKKTNTGQYSFKFAGSADDQIDMILPADGSTYTFIAYPVNKKFKEFGGGVTIDYTVGSGTTTIPPDCYEAQYNYSGNINRVYFKCPDNPVIVDFEIRSGVTWANSVLYDRVSTKSFVARSNGKYFIAARAVNSAGDSIYSAIPQEIDVDNTMLTKNVYQTIDEHATDYVGTYSGTGIVAAGASGAKILQLAFTGDILSADFLAIPDVLHYGDVSASETYTFSSGVDVGYSQNCDVIFSYDLSRAWFGDGPAPDTLPVEVIAIPQIRLSTDGSTFGPWVNYEAGKYIFWKIEFRVLLQSINKRASSQLTNLKVSVDVPDYRIRTTQTTLTGGPKTFNFTPNFKGGPDGQAYPWITPMITNQQTGDYFVLDSISLAGMTFSVRNSAGTRVARDVNLLIEGF